MVIFHCYVTVCQRVSHFGRIHSGPWPETLAQPPLSDDRCGLPTWSDRRMSALEDQDWWFGWFGHPPEPPNLFTLWWTNIAMENHHFFYGKIHYKWPFSIAMLVHQRVDSIQHGQAPSSQSTDRSSKLPSIALGPGVPSGYRADMEARPKRAPPAAARGKPPAGRTPAVSSTVAPAPAAGDAVDLKSYVSDELRKVLEEEEVGIDFLDG